MRFEDLNWMDVEKYLETDDRIILVTGACEQHGYLSLLTDVRIPMALADAASQQIGVPVAPALPYGVSPYFTAYPGTVSLKLATFLRLMTDLVNSFYQQGFRGLAILNGHGGNTAAREQLNELANELKDLRLFWYSWWQSEAIQAIAADSGRQPGHASWLEHFPFTQVTELPEGDSKIHDDMGRIWSAEETRQLIGDGVMGGEYQSDEKLQHELFAAALKDVMAGLDSIGKSS